jgi:hypothetical protein
VSPHNSTADFNQNSQASTNLPDLGAFNSLPSPTASANGGRGTYHMIRIDPGARLPGIPEHNYNGTLTLNLTPAWKIGLDVTAHSSSFVRGNENNLHAASVFTSFSTTRRRLFRRFASRAKAMRAMESHSAR